MRREIIGFLSFLCLCFYLAAPANSQDGTKATAELNLTQAASIPVRFNGRVTTLGVLAKARLLKISGVNQIELPKRTSAVKWFLDVIAAMPESEEVPIFPIAEPKILRLLQLNKLPRVVEYEKLRRENQSSDRGVEPPRFSVKDVRPRFSELHKESQRLQGEAKQTAYLDALLGVQRRLEAWARLQYLHRLPSKDPSRDELRVLLKRMQESGPDAEFQLHPVANGRWQNSLRAGIELRASKLLNQKPNPLTVAFERILIAYRRKDGDGFTDATSKYLQLTKQTRVNQSPISFTVPPRWIEQGVTDRMSNQFRYDVGANGETISMFAVGTAKQLIYGFIQHFTGPTTLDHEILNAWRIGNGRLPLTRERVSKLGTPIRIGDQDSQYYDFDAAPGIETYAKRVIGAILRRGRHTFVVTIGVPDRVTNEVAEIQSFLKSLKIGSEKQLDKWLIESKTVSEDRFQTTDVATVRIRSRIWVFVLQAQNGPRTKSTQWFRSFLKTVRPVQGGSRGVEWTTPAGFSHARPSIQPMTYVPSESNLNDNWLLQIYSFAEPHEFNGLILANHFRVETGLKAWKQGNFSAAKQNLSANGLSLELYRFEARPTKQGQVKQPRD